MEELPTRGQPVVARACGDEARICLFVKRGTNTVYLTDKAGFEELERGEDSDNVVEFHIGDVYLYNHGVSDGDRLDWSRLTPLTAVLGAGGGDGQ